MTKALDLSLPHKVADLSQADFGGKEMQLSEREMPGLWNASENTVPRSPCKASRSWAPCT